MGIFGKRMRIATKSIAVITIVVLLLLCNIFCDVVGQQQPQRLSQHNVYRNSTRRQNKQQEDIRIDCGNTRSSYTDSNGNKWLPDRNYTGGKVVRSYRRISNTADDWLYQTRREGKNIQYQIPVAPGEYEVRLLFAECRRFVRWFGGYRRKFNAILEKVQLEEIDLLALSHGQPRRAVQIVTESVLVEDGILTIELYGNPQVRSSTPVLSGIEIILSELHVVHAVPQGPYYGTIVEETNPTAMVPLIGETSHTHGFGLEIVNVQWTLAADRTLIGTALNVNSSFPVGNHTVSLTVQDSGNNTNTVNTTVIIRPFGFPVITQLLPNQGSIAGNDDIVITGGGFLYSAEQTTIVFGSMMVPTSNIIIRDSKTIQIKSPSTSISGPVMVQVITPVGDTNAMPFTYIGSVPIDWTSSTLSSLSIRGPAVGRFGPDQKLYVGTTKGQIYKITMDATFSNVVHFMATLVNEKQESILGIAFHPLDTKAHPDVYFTASEVFHSGRLNSAGLAINGRIRMASGPRLETITTIISGLPVSTYDHGINAIEFGDSGELYFSVGGNTNGGVPSRSAFKIRDNFLSAAISVAYISHPEFNGIIQWTAPEDGTMIAKGIELYAVGIRNAFGMVLHSNGKLYATNNGPNEGYGRMSSGCRSSDSIGDQTTKDSLILVQKGNYYGSPNQKRAAYLKDPRQCVWVNPEKPSSAPSGFTAPIILAVSAQTGLVEYHSNHFDGQLRSNLIMVRYKADKSLSRVILTPDGTAAIPESKTAIPLNIGYQGLDVTQAPNGNLLEIRYSVNSVAVIIPNEIPTDQLVVKTVFPHRGPLQGGNTLSIYGINMIQNGPNPIIRVGDIRCPIQFTSSNRIDCILPAGNGTVDVVVSDGVTTSTFESGYRYISGQLPADFILPQFRS